MAPLTAAELEQMLPLLVGELRSLAEHLARFESPPSSCPPTAPSYGSMLDPSEAEIVKIVKISAEGLQNAKIYLFQHLVHFFDVCAIHGVFLEPFWQSSFLLFRNGRKA